MKRAVLNLKDKDSNFVKPDFLLIDAEKLDSDIRQMSLVHGDALSHGIGAASIVAKVWRDDVLCREYDRLYPKYGIAKHKGYGTKKHREVLLELGPTPIHRVTFLKKILPPKEKNISLAL